MSITIPSTVSKAWDDLFKKGLSTDEYSYLVFDVTKTETDTTKKVQVFMKVYVPENKRDPATENVKKAMEVAGYAVEHRQSKTFNIPEIDIIVPNTNPKIKPNVIRVQFKPIKSSGSGGGAKQTAVQESTSCLYNALRFHVFPNEKLTPGMGLITTDHMNKAAEWIDTPGVTLGQMLDFANQDPDWTEVFMDGANKLYDKVNPSANNDFIFVRGDKDIDDGVVKEAFKKCKESLVHKELKNEDKWNPSDIWIVSKRAKGDIIKILKPYGVKATTTTIEVLNDALSQLFTDGKLMGLSLKKTGGSGTVKIVNADTPQERKENLGIKFEEKKSKDMLVYDSGRKFKSASDQHKQWPMDVYIQYGTGIKDNIQLRNFGGDNKGDWKLELKSEHAAMGKIQGNVARFILKHTGFTGVPDEPVWADCHPGKASDTKKKAITEEIYNLLKAYNATGFNTNSAAASKDKMMGDIEIKRQSWRYSKLAGLRFLEYLCQPGVDADLAIKELYLFGGSQADHSSIYYKYS